MSSDGGKVLPSAPAFYTGPNFSLPVVEVDAAKARVFEEAYQQLKRRLLKETFIFGCAGTAIAFAFAGATDGVTFGVGVAFGAAYLLLLERNTDQVGILHQRQI